MILMFNEMINIVIYVLLVIVVILLVVLVIMIVVVMYISVVERIKEIGIIKVIGVRWKDIWRIFVCEVFLIGVFSGVIGVVVLYLIMKGINIMLNKFFNINLVIIRRVYVVFGLCVSIIISMLFGLLFVNKVVKLDLVEFLRRE